MIGLFFIASPCFGLSLLETKDFALSMDTYLRNDLVTLKNFVDLDSANSDDTTTYLGIDYSLAFLSEFKNRNAKFYLKLERNGPFDYDAPLFVHNTLNSSGVIEKYRNDELLPQLEEFWLDIPLRDSLRFKSGLYTYGVGNGFALNGSYENYGFTLYQELKNATWRIYYCRPDIVYKNHLGPRIRQEEEQGIDYEHNATNFFATDVKFEAGKNTLWPYLGVLADYTSSGKRTNVFSAPIKKDILGTLGLAWDLKLDKLLLKVEAARNFGEAESGDPTYKDVQHRGWLAYTQINYNLDKFSPAFSFLVCSGNKVGLDEAGSSALTSGKNRAFSYFSPLNKNLEDSISGYNSDARPIVAMGAGYGLNYGIPRPKTFYASDFDNLLMPSVGFDFNATEKLCLGLYGYYLRAFEKGVGTFDGVTKYLSRDLGYEVDLFIDYQLNKNVLISFLGGYFFPGRFYRQERDDIGGSLFTPYVRGDGKTDSAYQVELAVEFKF